MVLLVLLAGRGCLCKELKHDIFPVNGYRGLFKKYGVCCGDPFIEMITETLPADGLAFRGRLVEYHCLACGVFYGISE